MKRQPKWKNFGEKVEEGDVVEVKGPDRGGRGRAPQGVRNFLSNSNYRPRTGTNSGRRSWVVLKGDGSGVGKGKSPKARPWNNNFGLGVKREDYLSRRNFNK